MSHYIALHYILYYEIFKTIFVKIRKIQKLKKVYIYIYVENKKADQHKYKYKYINIYIYIHNPPAQVGDMCIGPAVGRPSCRGGVHILSLVDIYIYMDISKYVYIYIYHIHTHISIYTYTHM